MIGIKSLCLLALPTVLALPAAALRAGVLLQPAAASFSGSSLYSPDNLRNQSGLSAPYTSLLTDFNAYLASNPTHNSFPATNDWISTNTSTSGNLDFDLGGTFTIQSVVLWNGLDDSGVQHFQFFADDNPSFSSPTSLGSFTFAHTGSTTTPAELFSFSPTSASFVRMTVISNFGLSNTELGEVAFDASPVPDPAAAPAGLALITLLASSRKTIRERKTIRGHHQSRSARRSRKSFLCACASIPDA